LAFFPLEQAPMLSPELRWCQASRAAKDSREKVLVAKTGSPADVRNRAVALYQQSFGLFNTHAANLFRWTAAHKSHESLL
jgi:hypothetical protein